MTVLMRTAFTDDYHARIKALDDMKTNYDTLDLHTMIQSVKASSDIVMSSAMMQELQQQISSKENLILECKAT